MALVATNINTMLVKNALGIVSDDIGTLCISPLINKWSRKKPVRGEFPASSNSRYGLDMNNNWAYLKPRGFNNNEEYRLDDFQGYEHDKDIAGPVLSLVTSGVSINSTMTPSGGFKTGSWTFHINTASDGVRIIPSDMGIGNFYFGIKLTIPGGGTYYKTHGTVLFDSCSIGINVGINNPATPSFLDCPYGVGTFSWSAFISSTSQTSWNTTAPSNIFYLPTGTFGSKTCINSGSFVVSNWMTLSDDSHSWLWTEYGSGNYKETIVYTNSLITRWYITNSTEHPFPSWLTYRVYDEDGTLDVTGDPTLWRNGCRIRLYPTVAQDPGDVALSGDVYINDGTNDLTSISASQEAAPALISFVTVQHWSGDTSDLLITNTSGYTYVGYTTVNVTFTPSIGGTLQYRVKIRNTETYNGTVNCTAGTAKTIWLQLGRAAVSGDPILIDLSVDLITD